MLTYSATDSQGNTGTATREVIVGNTVSLSPQSTWGFAGEEVVVPFVVTGFNAISGVQFSLEWDSDVMTLIQEVSNGNSYPKVSQSVTVPLSGTDFPLIMGTSFSITGDGQLTMLWDEVFQPEQGRSFDDDTVLFALHFKLADTPDLETTLSIENLPTPFKVAGTGQEDIPEVTTPATITIGNTEPPVVTLNGLATFLHEVMTPFTDPGASALDSVEGDLEVIVTGEVNPQQLGDYVLTYTATDRYGNEAAANRTVRVVDTVAPVITLGVRPPCCTLAMCLSLNPV